MEPAPPPLPPPSAPCPLPPPAPCPAQADLLAAVAGKVDREELASTDGRLGARISGLEGAMLKGLKVRGGGVALIPGGQGAGREHCVLGFAV